MNNDLISREALKKAVEDLVAGGAERLKDYYENGSKKEENEWIGGVYDAWELICDAPTVEYPFYQEAYQTGYEEGKNDKLQGKWISVSEGLPDEETDVLICNIKGDVEVSRGSYSTEVKDEFIWYTSGWRFGEVIAWKPLPKPYKKGGVEE